MNQWWLSLFPAADSEDELVPLYSLRTILGRWELWTPVKTFQIQPIRRRNNFYLFWDGETESDRHYYSVFDAIKAVAAHRTRLPEWDEALVEASDYLKHWKRRVSKRVIFNFIDMWIANNPHGSLRELVDYFEHEDTYLVERMKIDRFLEEMITTGQIERLPSDWMTPAELKGIVGLAKEYGIPVGPAT